VSPGFHGGTAAEVDELPDGIVFRKPVGHTARAAAAEDDDAGAKLREPREGRPDVADLFFPIDRRSGYLECRREKQVGGRNRKSELLDVRQRRFKVRIGQRGNFRRAQLQVVEPRGFGGVDALQRRARPT
jgi:hypothetical protein